MAMPFFSVFMTSTFPSLSVECRTVRLRPNRAPRPGIRWNYSRPWTALPINSGGRRINCCLAEDILLAGAAPAFHMTAVMTDRILDLPVRQGRNALVDQESEFAPPGPYRSRARLSNAMTIRSIA